MVYSALQQTERGKSTLYANGTRNRISTGLLCQQRTNSSRRIPFILNTDGTTHILRADTTQLKRIRLTRKYTFSDWLKTLCKRTWGGKFQVADKEDFSDSLTIATIDSITESRFHSLSTNYTGKYRYFRYLSPNGSHGNMAEVEMYDSVGVRPPVKNMFGARYATRDGNLERMFVGM